MKKQKNTIKNAFSMAPVALRLLVIVLAVLIVVVGAVSVSFSWFTPGSAGGSAMRLQEPTVAFRSENCTIETYVSTDSGDVLVNSSDVYTLSPGQMQRFTTTITNSNDETATDVSLFLTSIPAGAGIGVARPANNYKVYSSSATNQPLVRNAYVSQKDSSVIGSGYIDIVWFVKNTKTSGNISFNFGDSGLKPYVTYN